MQFLNEGFFLWRENKIQTHMALCEKVFAPHPLLKHNCGLSLLSSVSLASPRPDYCYTCSQSRNHLNRTCLTKWSRPKDPQKLHIMLRSKEIQEQMRKKVIEIYQSGKGYKAISKALGLQRTTVRAIIHNWRKHGTVVNLPRSGQKWPAWQSSKTKTAAEQKEHKSSSQFCQKTSWWSPRLLGKYSVDWRDKSLTFWKVCVPLHLA